MSAPATQAIATPEVFPSLGWFARLAERMAAQPEKYRKLGSVDLTLVARIVFPDGRAEAYRLAFEGHRCRAVERVEGDPALGARHVVILEGEYAAWVEMIESIRRHGRADLTHTLNYLTLPDWPFRLLPADDAEGQLDVDRFYRFNETLQEFFDEAAAVDTRFGGHGG
ncbi:MAG TPA: hypothetical protein VKA21_05130 [Candidatus Binatia bacterium]|nr:hypothetical protein [Candidatus Binatia bacterium]